MGYGNVLEQVAIQIAERRVAEQRFVRMAGLEAMQRLGIQDGNHHAVQQAMQMAQRQLAQQRQVELHNRRLQQQNAQLAQQRHQEDQQADLNARVGTLGRQMAQFKPLVFRAYGIHDNPQNYHRFLGHLAAYTATLHDWDGEYSREHCMMAGRILAEELQHTRSLPPPKRPQPKPLPPQRLGGRPGPQTPNGQPVKRGDWRDFQKQYFNQ
jgi:hypothetical protein